MPAMETPLTYTVRRATLDDLPALRELWSWGEQPLELVEKQFTQVQLAESSDGALVGALFFQADRQHGHIHHDTVMTSPDEDKIRAAFWERLEVLGRNHGLFRLWTQSTDPFWIEKGFKAPDAKALEKLPPSFQQAGGQGPWLCLVLKQESAEGLSVEQQFEIFTQSQRAETERLISQAQTLKKVAYTILLIVSVGFLVYAAKVWVTYNRARAGRKR